jgi:anti-sigma B factor antagonist
LETASQPKRWLRGDEAMTRPSWQSFASEAGPTSRDRPSVAAVESEGTERVVIVRGEVDVSTAPQLRACLEEVTDSSQPRVVVDVGDVQFIDSSGIAVLAAALKRLRPAGRDLVVRRPTPQMTKLLDMTGMGALVTVSQQPFE